MLHRIALNQNRNTAFIWSVEMCFIFLDQINIFMRPLYEAVIWGECIINRCTTISFQFSWLWIVSITLVSYNVSCSFQKGLLFTIYISWISEQRNRLNFSLYFLQSNNKLLCRYSCWWGSCTCLSWLGLGSFSESIPEINRNVLH